MTDYTAIPDKKQSPPKRRTSAYSCMLVLRVIDKYAQGILSRCQATNETLSRETGLSTRTVSAAIRQLSEDKLIQVAPHKKWWYIRLVYIPQDFSEADLILRSGANHIPVGAPVTELIDFVNEHEEKQMVAVDREQPVYISFGKSKTIHLSREQRTGTSLCGQRFGREVYPKLGNGICRACLKILMDGHDELRLVLHGWTADTEPIICSKTLEDGRRTKVQLYGPTMTYTGELDIQGLVPDKPRLCQVGFNKP